METVFLDNFWLYSSVVALRFVSASRCEEKQHRFCKPKVTVLTCPSALQQGSNFSLCFQTHWMYAELNHRCNCWTSTNLSSQATLCNLFHSTVLWYALSRKRGTNAINQKWKSRTHSSAVSTSTKPRTNNIKTHTYVPENHPSSPFRVFCGAAEVKCL